ncbi:hypothetical protein M8C21_031742 [Ambrosia artemisiifolia]|uniref:Rieske domain-containing protein n=1 Tax=Ambrosia artemisiifolia TaxID=4212 RepID=A0AAD5D782_AMBAR|nr:hypothetical protein M8C21_031742 [Ambrosia artemisiifolia]
MQSCKSLKIHFTEEKSIFIMEALTTVSTVTPPSITRAHFSNPIFSLSFAHKISKPHLLNITQYPKSTSTKFNVISPSVPTEAAAPPEEETETGSLDQEEKFDWFSHWYPLMPVCDLDKRAPRGMKVLGLDVVVWWDKNQNEWRVFDDRCPHRLAPLSEGRIDQWGRLQCVYHGWCFGGSGDCKLIPQAPLDGPPVHSFPKACVGVYPCTVQYGIVWFWPSTDPQYKDILKKKKPPYIPELAHPSYAFQTYYRDIPYGLIEKGGKFGQKAPEEDVLIFLCIPVSPGNSRLITVIPRHLWVDVFYSKWKNHMTQNLIVDSDLYLLRIQEEKVLKAGPLNWQKVSFVPAKADGNVVLFRKWLKKYAGGQFDWGTKFNGALPPIPPREQFFDRYWSHVVNCSTCNGAYKRFKALKISLQMFSVASVAIMAATKPGMISVAARNTIAVAAILCFVGSKWLSHFIYKTFHFHDYNHAFK